MKKVSGFILVAAVMSLASGCTTLHSSQPSGQMNVTVDAPLKADIKVGDKIKGTAYVKTLLGFIQLEGTNHNKFADGVSYGAPMSNSLMQMVLGREADPLLAAAAYDAVTKSGADVIIAPQYSIEVEDNLLVVKKTVVVTGYKGTINSIKSAH